MYHFCLGKPSFNLSITSEIPHRQKRPLTAPFYIRKVSSLFCLINRKCFHLIWFRFSHKIFISYIMPCYLLLILLISSQKIYYFSYFCSSWSYFIWCYMLMYFHISILLRLNWMRKIKPKRNLWLVMDFLMTVLCRIFNDLFSYRRMINMQFPIFNSEWNHTTMFGEIKSLSHSCVCNVSHALVRHRQV